MVYIKRVIIEGFKSYRDLTKFEDFDQHVNVIGEWVYFNRKWFLQLEKMDLENPIFSLVSVYICKKGLTY